MNTQPADASQATRGTLRQRRRLRLVGHLAFEDYRHEWVLSGCGILALAAILIPLLVLFGLKYGIIHNLLEPLVNNPQYREITPVASGKFDPEWFTTVRARSDVAFVVPRTRSLAALVNLRATGANTGRIIAAELVPSGKGDPALAGLTAPAGLQDVVLSTSAALKLQIHAGDQVQGILTRTLNGKQDAVRFNLTVTGIAPPLALTRDGLFVSIRLMDAVEDFLDGRAVPAFGWQGDTPRPASRSYPSFRLFATSIDAVKPLRQAFIAQGIDVRTHAADIALVQTLNRNLNVVYWVIALLAIGGYCLSFGTQVWANVDRKQREFSVLRLTGFRTREIVWFPVVQAAFTASLAWVLACVVFLGVQALLNALFATNAAAAGGVVCRLLPWHFLVALGLTLVAAEIAAVLGGRRVANLEPSLGLRDD